MPEHTLDTIDVKILHRLQRDARVSNVALAESVDLSAAPCLRRVRMLEESGIIQRYVALLNPSAVGFDVSVFVQVTLEKQVAGALKVFEHTVLNRPEVMECYLMTGDADYLLRIVVPDIAAYEQLLLNHITAIPGVASIKSSFALKQIKYSTALPLD